MLCQFVKMTVIIRFVSLHRECCFSEFYSDYLGFFFLMDSDSSLLDDPGTSMDPEPCIYVEPGSPTDTEPRPNEHPGLNVNLDPVLPHDDLMINEVTTQRCVNCGSDLFHRRRHSLILMDVRLIVQHWIAPRLVSFETVKS